MKSWKKATEGNMNCLHFDNLTPQFKQSHKVRLIIYISCETFDNEKSAQRRCEHCELAVVRRTHKQTNTQTDRGDYNTLYNT